MSENFTKALHSSQFLAEELREAYLSASKNDNPLMCLLLEPIMAKAVNINQELKRLEPHNGETHEK
jgi:hypothetical protein